MFRKVRDQKSLKIMGRRKNPKDHCPQNCCKPHATKSQTTEAPPTKGSTEVNQAPPTDPSDWLAVLLDAVKTDLVSTQQAFGRISSCN
ncbi:hypothetical protein AMELA_G00007430 [Ameiurus melas]|uniref:Uncharacterized protein n=1 Tax=Ameiurus melas TaxID=219545 RepID=A0A7J6BGA6_AMEME|nr:hypothetical protein AMELA_G00007430 [Ameiurus melas]